MAADTRFMRPGSGVRVKFCGMVRPEDAVHACETGADAIGLVFYPASSRALSVEQAADIIRLLPPEADITRVGLFVDAVEEEIRRVLRAVPLHLLQFHGEETPEECRRYQLPYIKALRLGPEGTEAAMRQVAMFYDAFGILWDRYDPSVPGGGGRAWNWGDLPAPAPDQRWVMAGGLKPDNVATVIQKTHPYAVDVSSGIESQPGVKQADLMKQFIHEVRSHEFGRDET